MSPRTYIGPFGRILPVSDDRELERQRLPEHALDETRTNKLNYQLPPPKRLEFGTDVSSGFTEPMRYNTISQSSRTQGSRHQLFSESPKLPSVHQILKPPSSSNAPTLTPHSPQRSPTPAQPPRGTFTSPRVPSSDQVVRASQYNNGTDCSQPQMTTQVQYQTTVSPPREDYQISPSTHHFPTTYGYQRSLHVSPYVSSFESNGLTAYSSQSHQIAPPIVRHQQQTNPSDAIHVQPMLPYSTGQTQHMQPVNGPSPYPHGQTSTYQAPITPMVTAETSQSAPSNPVKPQPRLVAERDIPGEGPSWVYEDGSTCKKVIDGETVNAQWGVTKAGKPRKRLAIACTTCREKKIKCDPAEPKCVQCEKFDRECKFMTAFRNPHSSSNSPSYDSQARTSLTSIKTDPTTNPTKTLPILRSTCEEDHKALKRRKSPPETGYIKLEAKTPLSKATRTKKQRSSLPGLPLSKSESEAITLRAAETAPESFIWDKEQLKVNNHAFDWCNDPFDVDSGLSSHYVESYFNHINDAIYRMFPRRPFFRWAQRAERKSREDLMTVYAMLAVGSMFSSRPDHNAHGSLFCKIALHAMESSHGNLSLQLTHSRLLLALYYFSVGEHSKSWDYSGMAIRAASGLRLGLEGNYQDLRADEELDYGLNKYALAECHRRAFWAVYLTDRFSAFGPGHVCMLHNGDTYLRLPCEDRRYEDQEYVDTPYFDNGLVDEKLCAVAERSSLGPMAFSVQISSLWSEILGHVFRSSHGSSHQYVNDFESFYSHINRELLSWTRSLPSYLTYSKSNATICVSSGDIGSFVSLHAIYHSAIIKLNRNIRHALLSSSIISRNIQAAFDHARQLLETLQMIGRTTYGVQTSSHLTEDEAHPVAIAYSTPFVGYAIFSAVDVLSAGGSLKTYASTIALMESGLIVFEKLNRFWASARQQSKAIRWRLDRLTESVSSKAAVDKIAWKCRAPLENNFERDQDAFYDAEDKSGVGFLGHLGLETEGNEVLFVD